MKSNLEPSKEALIKNLELQWQDHFHARNQTWKALTVTATLAVALIGLDWQTDNLIVTLFASFLLAMVATFGIQITIRHRNVVERNKFRSIIEIENKLGLDSNYQVPLKIEWYQALLFRKSNTSLFILRMQFVILIFAVINLIIRLINLI